ncbi:Restriction of telomere capping protein 5 [Rasamsonia emersonii CBS 393.64]|uniref:Restriction of telomere capping protein 5 n=1 Tax=Rasamsonia emersonii (strain ATCC 16479 / CBS 393.64 / IMI 116815) TaxID=1408163 RepID=A0A0F4YXN9_RASE3|nr:Restriction of telomere capping protein 5 [Rasamsonia emersonii CBS 393.64]KKA22611.1 Restriction of telomere capping protein 5 [Rasamsonia emersonii CBS 393.64]
MGAAQSTEGAGNASPEELSHLLAERFATKCFTPLELTHFKDNFFSRALDQGGLRYWNEKILSDFLGIPDGVNTDEKGAGRDAASLDAGPVIFRMVSYLGAFPFQTTLAPSVLTFEAMVKVVVLLTERYGKVLKRGRKDRIKLLFGSLADVARRDIEEKKVESAPGEPAPSSSSEAAVDKHTSHPPGFAIDEPANDDDEEEDDDDLALAALESLDAIEVFKHDQRIDRAVYEARISVDTFRRLLMLLLVIAPLKPLESVSKYTSNLSPDQLAAVRREADSIIAAFSPEEIAGGIRYRSFARTVSVSLPHLFDPLTPLFEHLLFSKNLDLSRKRTGAEPSHAEDEGQNDSNSPPEAPVILPGSFESAILNPSIISHLSFFLPASPDVNLFRSGTRLHPVFSTTAHGESLTSFSHNVLTWQAPTLLLIQGTQRDRSGAEEKLITLGAYLPQPWKPTSPRHKPTTPAVFFSTSTGIAIGCEVAPPSRNSFGPGVPVRSSHSKRQQQQAPIPIGAGSLLIDEGLETAELHVSYTSGAGGVFLPPVPSNMPVTTTQIDIYNLEIWGLVEDPISSSDPNPNSSRDAIALQRAQWAFDAREAERRRTINLKVGGSDSSSSDVQSARALLEMAGIISDSGKSGGSV